MSSRLAPLLEACRAEQRAALVGYLPAGYPSVGESRTLLAAMLDGTEEGRGCDLLEVGVPYSDPVLDGPTIQRAADAALRGGVRLRDVFSVVESVAAGGGRAMVMTYWNPVYRYGVDAFARDLAAAGGLGVITPDLVPEEAEDWLAASDTHRLDRVFLVAPSSSQQRIVTAAAATRGFLYATSVMGVTGARETVSSAAGELVGRIRAIDVELPVGVGLGVRSAEQAAQVAAFADAVIVGSAFVTAARNGEPAVRGLAADLAGGVRRAARQPLP